MDEGDGKDNKLADEPKKDISKVQSPDTSNPKSTADIVIGFATLDSFLKSSKHNYQHKNGSNPFQATSNLDHNGNLVLPSHKEAQRNAEVAKYEQDLRKRPD